MKPMEAWEMEAVFVFTGIVILIVALSVAFLVAQLMDSKARRGKKEKLPGRKKNLTLVVQDDPCEKCLRWPECNGVDEACPVRKPGSK